MLEQWFCEDGETSWNLYKVNPDFPEGHPLRIIKAPKKSIEFTAYWPTKADTRLIIAVPELYEIALQVKHIGLLADDPTCPDEFLTAEVQILREKTEIILDRIAKPDEEIE